MDQIAVQIWLQIEEGKMNAISAMNAFSNLSVIVLIIARKGKFSSADTPNSYNNNNN